MGVIEFALPHAKHLLNVFVLSSNQRETCEAELFSQEHWRV